MDQPLTSRFFLGANSPRGFASLYGEFTDPARDTLYILKGGPGCGKSTMMKAIAKAASDAGLDTELIHCSGDPQSLDGVKIPGKRTAYVDGTSPHVVEPLFAGSQGVYVNLGAFYDREALDARREDIARLTLAYKERYDRAFRLLAGAASLSGPLPLPEEAVLAARKRARAVLKKELRGGPSGGRRGGSQGGAGPLPDPSQGPAGTLGEPPKSTRRFLSAYSCEGHLTLWDTVRALCPRVWVLDDDLGLGGVFVAEAAGQCASLGVPAVECMDPMCPDRIEHLLVPGRGFALVTQTSGSPCPLTPHRHLRLDAVPDREALPALKAAARRSRKLRAPLLGEALDALREAKALHDELEALYIPTLDVNGVEKLTRRHIRALLD